jgi:hypothetical protein
MENSVQYWQFVTERTAPRMAHRSNHGVQWWSIDSNSAHFLFRNFKCSMGVGN